jgi:poly(3-hydroxybutyrate) depolymerase
VNRIALLVITVCIVACSGCPQYHSVDVPNEIQRQVTPLSRTPYFVYVPSTYDRRLKWPLIVLCHGTRPWDTARRQIFDWVRLAEEKGFVVVAPELSGTSAFPQPSLRKQLSRQSEDEQRILDTVRHVRGAYNISSDRIFLTGWSAGNYAVLYTGLRNPNIFRALACQQGNFDMAFLAPAADRVDPHQPIAIIFGQSDVLAGDDPHKSIHWLEDHGAKVFSLEVSGGHRGHPMQAQQFFERVLRQLPLLQVRTLPGRDDDPMSVRFKTRASVEPDTYTWDFGDGSGSHAAEPLHRYESPGEYTVTLVATKKGRGKLERETRVVVPSLTVTKPRRTQWDDAETSGK